MLRKERKTIIIRIKLCGHCVVLIGFAWTREDCSVSIDLLDGLQVFVKMHYESEDT